MRKTDRERDPRPYMQSALRLFCVLGRIPSGAQFGRLVGYPAKNLYQFTERDGAKYASWPGNRFLTRLIRLTILHASGDAPIWEIEEVNWKSALILWHKKSKTDNPLRYRDGHVIGPGGEMLPTDRSRGWGMKGDNPFADAYSRYSMMMGAASSMDVQRFGRLLGTGPHDELRPSEWHTGSRPLGPLYGGRLLLLLVWDGLGMIHIPDIESIDWRRRQVTGRVGKSAPLSPFRQDVAMVFGTLYEAPVGAFDVRAPLDMRSGVGGASECTMVPSRPVLDRRFHTPHIDHPVDIFPRGSFRRTWIKSPSALINQD